MSNRCDTLQGVSGLPRSKASQGRQFCGCVRGDLTSSELGGRRGLQGVVSRSLTKTRFGSLPRIPRAFSNFRDGQLSKWEKWEGGDPAVCDRGRYSNSVQLASCGLPQLGPTAAPHPRPPRALARSAHSLLGRAPHRGPGLRAARHLPALPRRRLGAARSGPRSGLRHGSPTHGRPRRALRSGRPEPWLRGPAPREVRPLSASGSVPAAPPPRPLTL